MANMFPFLKDELALGFSGALYFCDCISGDTLEGSMGDGQAGFRARYSKKRKKKRKFELHYIKQPPRSFPALLA